MKKIIVFTSDGAGGHTATTNALRAFLADSYLIQPVNIFKDVMSPLDIIQLVTRGSLNGEQFYEKCLSRKYYTFLNTLHTLGKLYYKTTQRTGSSILQHYLEREAPALVISVVPLLDGAIVDATKKLKIPFLLIPTDLDSTNYIHDIRRPNHAGFHVTLPFEDHDIKQFLAPAKIPSEQISVAGFPIRADFFAAKDRTAIKASFQVPLNKPVIVLLMGSVGSNSLYTFAQQLARIQHEAHIVICVGRFEAIKEKIKTIVFPKHLTITLVDFIQNISDLMAIADLLITKAGPVTLSEAVYMNVPTLIDITSSTLAWEKFNYQFIQKYRFGDTLKRIEELPAKVNYMLGHRNILESMKSNLASFEKKHGGQEVKKIIEGLI